MKNALRLPAAILLACAASLGASAAESPLPADAAAPDSQDVAWHSPSKNAYGSMPLGNGDIGLNVWVEEDGDLVLLIGKTDAFDEFNRLLKIGRLRLRTTPALFTPGQTFSQVLRLKSGAIAITSGATSLRVWVDANHPVAQVDLKSPTPVQVRVLADNWRKENGKIQNGSSATYSRPDKLLVNADTVLAAKAGQIGWCHHNVESQWQRNLELTALGDEVAKAKDPVLNRSFGAIVRAPGCAAVSAGELTTAAPVTDFSVQIASVTTFADSAEKWQAAAEAQLDQSNQTSAADRFAAHEAWWRNFWSRSWITLKGDANAVRASQAYALQRFVSSCSGRGSLPIKFNGSIFTVAGPDPDHRNWGGAYWWQNTREAYWAMPYAGDYDQMLPLFAMYKNALPLREAATKKYYGHAGAFFPETMYFWGNYTDGNYGTNRQGKPDGLTDNAFIRRYWQGGLELTAMMLDYFDGTQDAAFRDKTLLPLAKSITTFFDQHWARKDGKIFFSPAQSLETWHTATNPLPEIAGLRYLLPRLLKLETDKATKAMWRKTLADLPPVPTADVKGKLCIRPAETFGKKSNVENPELYAVFPYRLYTGMLDAKELEPALNAWRVRRHPEDKGWQQNCIQAALLGLAAEAKAMVEARARSTAGGYRFPGFFGPNYDWTPEQCHGTNMMTAMQRMAMQCEGDRIVLLPAWPKAWEGSFKLHAPKNTVVEGRIEAGKVLDLKVTPESRRKDVEIREAQ